MCRGSLAQGFQFSFCLGMSVLLLTQLSPGFIQLPLLVLNDLLGLVVFSLFGLQFLLGLVAVFYRRITIRLSSAECFLRFIKLALGGI